MVRSKLMTNIMVLGLVLTFCQSAQSMETGYTYPDNVSIADDILYNDLQCTYLFSGLTHMLLTRHLLYSISPPFFSLKMNSAINEIHLSYSAIIKYQLDSLFRLKIVRIGSLWTLYLYLGIIRDFYDALSNKDKAGLAIIATHRYVIAQLDDALIDCRENNSFDIYKTLVGSGQSLPLNDVRSFINDNNARAVNLLKTNNILRGQSANETFDNMILQVESIFLSDLGWKDAHKKDLMDVYNVQVDWRSTSHRLTQSWHDARTLYWSTDELANVKSYFILCFNFLKIIMFRLTLKHLCYLEPFSGTDLYVRYAKEWYKMVKQFGDMLSLSGDLHVRDLLISFDNLVENKEKIDSVVNYLTAILTTLCLPFGCEAAREFELNGREFQTSYMSPLKEEMNVERLKNEKSPVPIEYHSLENTRIFLNYLSRMFRFVDFNLVRSLVEYINQVNP